MRYADPKTILVYGYTCVNDTFVLILYEHEKPGIGKNIVTCHKLMFVVGCKCDSESRSMSPDNPY